MIGRGMGRIPDIEDPFCKSGYVRCNAKDRMYIYEVIEEMWVYLLLDWRMIKEVRIIEQLKLIDQCSVSA